MPAVEIASFTASKAFLSDIAVANFNKAIDALKSTEGCLSVYRGFQLEDKSRAYVVTTWNSYEKYVNTTKGTDYNSFRIELEKLGSTLNDLSIQLLVVDNDLAFFLDAPIPELRITLPKQGQTTEKFVSTLRTFYAQVKNDEYADLKYGDLPSWVMGSDKQNPGYSVYLVGWKDVETRETVHETKAFMGLVEKAHGLVHFEVKCLSLTKV